MSDGVEESEREMVQSMLELTTEDVWDDLSAAARLELAKMKLNGSDGLSEEQERWLIDEQNRAMVDLKETMIDCGQEIEANVKSYLKDVWEALHPSAEMAEDADDNGSGSSDTEKSQVFLSNTIDVSAQCPHCERSETFDDPTTAQAWLTTHILTYHRDELPDPGVSP